MPVDYKAFPVPFDNAGLTQRKDPSELAPGEYYQLENAFSQQEGALSIRTGHKQFLPDQFTEPINSLAKLTLGGADSANPRYMGGAGSIYRELIGQPAVQVMTGILSARWTASQYNQGSSGTPAAYFATYSGAYKDTGSYTLLQNWGCDPPLIPVTSVPSAPTYTTLGLPSGSTNRFVANTNSNGSSQKTVTIFGSSNSGTGSTPSPAGYTQVTPTAASPINGLNGIYAGMLININDSTGGNETVVVLALFDTYFTCWTTLSHIYSNVLLTATQSPLSLSTGITQTSITGLTVNASYNGIAQNAYAGMGVVNIGLYVSNSTLITDFRIRMVPNFTGSPYATDYFEKSILPSSLTPYVGTSASTPQSAVTTIQQITSQVNDGVYNPYVNTNDIVNQIQPYQTQASVPSAPIQVWTEISIPLSEFTAIGNAGTGAYNWQNINQFYIYIVATGSVTVEVADIYVAGGTGLNSNAAGTTVYDYLYTNRNPNTGYESNPCQFQIPANIAPPVQNQPITLTLTGTANTSASGNGDFTGPGSLAVYRRGGSFADGLFRCVGYAANPGANTTVAFADAAADASLNQANIIEFDNNPPVLSNLPLPLTANISSFQPSGGGSGASTSTANAINRIELSNLPTNYTTIGATITVGSVLNVGTGLTAEQAYVTAIPNDGSTWVEAYLQFVHNETSADPTETVVCGDINRGTCDLAAQEFDRMFLAGDPNNPHVLYASKTGAPEVWPYVNQEDGYACQINVGTPSNPIMGLTSLNSQIVSLNQSCFFIVQNWNGALQTPYRQSENMGLYAKFCWANDGAGIWFLGYDGIYYWTGGASQKSSAQVDYLFRGLTVNGIAPIDMTQAASFSFTYARRQLFVSYMDTTGTWKRLRFEVDANRWHIESIYNYTPAIPPSTPAASVNVPITAMMTEKDTGYMIVAVNDSLAGARIWQADFYSTTDGWQVIPSDGYPINLNVWRYWALSGDPGMDIQVGEVMLELSNAFNAVSMALFYNYATTATETVAVPIPTGFSPGRYRFVKPVNFNATTGSGTPQTAYSIGLQLTCSTGNFSNAVQLFTFGWRALPLEEITAGATGDWHDLDHPYDKLLYDVALQYDTGGQPNVTMALDTINGLQGNTLNSAVLTMALVGAQRSQQTYIMPDQTIAKLIRFRPINGSLNQFKWWKYQFRKEDYPPDTITATPWSQEGFSCDKIFKVLTMEVDTGGVACSVAFQIDGQTAYTFTVTSTFQDRGRIITLPSSLNGLTAPLNMIGREYRLVPTPGAGGKFQLFSKLVQFEKEPCAVTHWDSYEQVFGFNGWKYIKQIWLEYLCNVSTVFSIYTDNNQLFWQQVMPAQTARAVQRFYLPTTNIPAGGTASILNKSKVYRFMFDSSDKATAFKLYRDGSRCETRQLDGDQRSGYEQHVIWEQMPLAS